MYHSPNKKTLLLLGTIVVITFVDISLIEPFHNDYYWIIDTIQDNLEQHKMHNNFFFHTSLCWSTIIDLLSYRMAITIVITIAWILLTNSSIQHQLDFVCLFF